MGSLKQSLYPNPLQSFNSSGLSGSYQNLGSPLANASRIIKITNNSTQIVTISWDGINDHDILPANSFLLLDVSTNRESPADACEIPKGTQFLVKGSAGTGLIYLSSYYAR